MAVSSPSPVPDAGSPADGERAARAFASRAHGVLIGGELEVLAGAERMPVENPATEEPLAEVPVADGATVDRAVTAARAAFEDGRWRALQPARMETAMRRLARLVREHREELEWL